MKKTTETAANNTEKNRPNKSYNYEIPYGRITYILSFLIPMIILTAIYAARKIYPFFNGDNCYLRSDMYHQYAPFFAELWNKLSNGGNMTYSWNMGLGVNFTALYAYYLSCPLNWFIFLFPHKYLIEVMNVLIILKLSLASLAFTWYLSKKSGSTNIFISVFGMFYALSGYVAAYCWNIMWLDCILLLPLIIGGLERLVKENKCFLYCITLGLAILSNYYISIMICISLVIYFIVLMVSEPKTTLKNYVIKCVNFAVFSLLAGGLAAMLLIPELYALKYTVSSKINFPKTLSNYFPIMEMLIRHLSNIEVHTGLEHYPNIYCGVGIFLLFPLYIMNERITIREKFGKCLVLLVFLTAFNMNILNFIWHGFHYPNSLPCRQSFIYCFVLLTMCYDAFRDIRHFSMKQLTSAGFIALAFLLVSEQCYSGDQYNFKIFYISGAFIIFYMLLMYLYQSKKVIMPVFIFLFFLSTILECALNMEATGFSTTGRSYYLSDYDSMEDIIDYLDEQDNSFYRIEKFSGFRSKNDDAWHGYRGVSNFSSTAHGGLGDFLGFLGCEHSVNAYGYNGATFLTSTMLSVKYIVSNSELTESKLISHCYTSGNRYLYRLNYTLPLGFMVTSQLEENWNTANSNPFIVQNDFLFTTVGISDIFSPLTTESISNSSSYVNVEKKQHVYLYISAGTDSVNVYIDENSKNYDIKHNRILDIGVVSPEQVVRVSSEDPNKTMTLLAYTIDEDKFIMAYDMLNAESLQITDFDDTHISGEIDVKHGGILFTSIPYDKGWTVLVDGMPCDIIEVKEAFLGIDLNVGKHTVKFSYAPEGYHFGVAITILCVIILIAIYMATDNHYELLMKKISKKRRK